MSAGQPDAITANDQPSAADPVTPLLLFLRGNPQERDVELVIGMGDQTCQVYKVNRNQLRNLAVAATDLAFKWVDP